jgi:hypothetical protein
MKRIFILALLLVGMVGCYDTSYMRNCGKMYNSYEEYASAVNIKTTGQLYDSYEDYVVKTKFYIFVR